MVDIVCWLRTVADDWRCDEAADEIERLRAENARLRGALQHAVEELEFWGAYASDYFKEKHGFDETIEKLSTALAEKEKK